VARTGPPDEFHHPQTQYPNYGMGGYPPPAVPPGPPPEPPPERQEPPDYLDPLDPLDQEVEPTPWYRKPAGLISWLVAVLILIGLIVYGIIELIQGEGGGYTPGTSTTTTPATVTSTAPSPTPPTSSATTTTPTAPPTSSAVEPPTRQPTQQQPTHRHHLPPLPSVITIPEVPTVITLPPGLTD
jgi:hypothetical protein